jgi:hypothetical protein
MRDSLDTTIEQLRDVDHDPGLVGVLASRDGGIDRDHDPHELPAIKSLHKAALNRIAGPKRPLEVVEQLAAQLLTPESRALVAAAQSARASGYRLASFLEAYLERAIARRGSRRLPADHADDVLSTAC